MEGDSGAEGLFIGKRKQKRGWRSKKKKIDLMCLVDQLRISRPPKVASNYLLFAKFFLLAQSSTSKWHVIVGTAGESGCTLTDDASKELVRISIVQPERVPCCNCHHEKNHGTSSSPHHSKGKPRRKRTHHSYPPPATGNVQHKTPRSSPVEQPDHAPTQPTEKGFQAGRGEGGDVLGDRSEKVKEKECEWYDFVWETKTFPEREEDASQGYLELYEEM